MGIVLGDLEERHAVSEAVAGEAGPTQDRIVEGDNQRRRPFERWVERGVHLSSIKQPEIEIAALKRADRIVLHAHEASPVHVTTRDLALAKKAKEHGWSVADELDFEKLPTLPELITRRAPGRASDSEITCFMNNIGLGYQFAAAGAVVYRKARAVGAGRELPTEWFTEDVHP